MDDFGLSTRSFYLSAAYVQLKFGYSAASIANQVQPLHMTLRYSSIISDTMRSVPFSKCSNEARTHYFMISKIQ